MTAVGPKNVRLDDLLDYLHSDAGAALVTDLRADLERSGAQLREAVVDVTLGDRGMPEDRFERGVTDFLYRNFLTQAEIGATIPQAVAATMAEAAGPDGTVDPKAVGEVLGHRAQSLLETVAQRVGGQEPANERPKAKYQHLPDAIRALVAKSARPDGLVQRMPILAELSRNLGGPEALAGYRMVSVQHLFPTTKGLFESLADNGLQPEATTIIGKSYSTNDDTYERMVAEGWNLSWLSRGLTELVGEDGKPRGIDPAAGHLRELLADVDPTAADAPKFLLLDEGGKLLKALHREFPEHAKLCVAVEQTDRGVQILDDLAKEGIDIACPVVNVARSSAKKVAESPMIGESVADSIDGALRELHPDLVVEPKVATILGYGAVGKATADALRRRGYAVQVHDIDPQKMAAAAADGCTPMSRDRALANGHLLVSCTGRGTMTIEEQAALPDGAVLVNAASGNHELGTEVLHDNEHFLNLDNGEWADERGIRRGQFKGLDVRLGDLAAGDKMYHRILRGDDGRERLVLRNGYVVNMTEDIPPEFIQLTRGLLLAACLQAVGESEPGLSTLDPDTQRFITNRVQGHLKKNGLDLYAPDFRRLK